MSIKKGIGYSPLTDKVYLGKQNKEKGMWVGDKEDITNEFIAVSFAYFSQDTIRTITSSDGSKNIFINIKEDKKSLEKLIKNLTQLLDKQNG